jgi:hypothetical protein
MHSKLEYEINSEEEMNLYDYWKVLVKRKKIFACVFFIPLVIVTTICLTIPHHYIGEAEISYSASLSANIVKFAGNVNDTKKVKIFKNNSDAVKNVLISIPYASSDKVKISVDAKTADIIPQAFKDVHDYINNIPEIKEETAAIKEENNYRIKNLTEAKKANLIFLNYTKYLMKKRQIALINPADLIKKDADLSLEIINLQKAEMKFGTFGPLSIAVQPSHLQIRKIIISTGALSLVAAIFFVLFLLDYIERIKVRENKD